MKGEQSSISAHGGGEQEIIKKLSTSGNYKCSVQDVYDAVKIENKLMGGR